MGSARRRDVSGRPDPGHREDDRTHARGGRRDDGPNDSTPRRRKPARQHQRRTGPRTGSRASPRTRFGKRPRICGNDAARPRRTAGLWAVESRRARARVQTRRMARKARPARRTADAAIGECPGRDQIGRPEKFREAFHNMPVVPARSASCGWSSRELTIRREKRTIQRRRRALVFRNTRLRWRRGVLICETNLPWR